jgi:archaeosine synthase
MIASAERERWQDSCSRVVGSDSPLESFKRIVRHARTMSERAMARSVVARQRFSRLFALGDRKSPISWSPALVIGSEDNELPISLAPLTYSRDGKSLPAKIQMSTRGNLCLPFDSTDEWHASEGLVLPPSLSESNSGEFGTGDQILPVSWQSLHHDISLLDETIEPSVIILTDAPQLAQRPGMLVDAIYTLRTRFPTSLLWTVGIGGPDNCALLAWMGVDLFDLSRSRHASSLGVLLTEDGPRPVEASLDEDCTMISQLAAWKAALAETRSAIREGSLRELAERQSLSSPRSVERLRRHDAKMSGLSGEESGLTRIKGQDFPLRCHSYTSRNDALIIDWQRRIAESHSPPVHQTEILLLLPCSAKKPYRLSASHRRFRNSITSNRVHEVMVTAPLGLVPRELEDIWPAGNYDIPVTGEWDLDELTTIREMINKFAIRNGYSRIINHSGIHLEVEGIDIIDTRQGESAGNSESLTRLENEVSRAAKEYKLSSPKESIHRLNKLCALSLFQHGTDEWLAGCKVEGRPPIYTIKKDRTQLARWNPRIGRFSFSKASLPLLHESGKFPIVNLVDNFDWKGDLFSTNIKSKNGEIRAGDEVLVYQNDTLIGSARAEAAGWEWPEGPGRLAKAQHRL